MVGCLITKCSHICYWKHPIFNSVSRIFNHFRLMSSLVLPSFLYIFKNVFETKSKEWKGGFFFAMNLPFVLLLHLGPLFVEFTMTKTMSTADHNSQMQFLTESIGTVQAPPLGEILVNTMTLNLSAMMTDTSRSLASQWHRWYVIGYDSWCLFVCL